MIRDGIYVKLIQKDSLSIYRISRYTQVIFRYVTEDVTGDRNNPYMLIVQKPEREVVVANNDTYLTSNGEYMNMILSFLIRRSSGLNFMKGAIDNSGKVKWNALNINAEGLIINKDCN